jgi:hypothetical protein
MQFHKKPGFNMGGAGLTDGEALATATKKTGKKLPPFMRRSKGSSKAKRLAKKI